MRAFEYFTATDAKHAVALLAEHAPARVLAGGTDLLADLKSSPAHAPKTVVDISRARDLRKIELNARGLCIGALVTHSEIMASKAIADLFPALIDAAHTIGAVQTRNLGTLGGNLVTAVPSMDSGPTLVALDAQAVIAGSKGKRSVPLAEFFVGPRRTVLKADELLVEIVIPKANLGKPAHFLKTGLRKGQALALVNAAGSLWVDAKKNTCRDVRIALGAVAPTVIRATTAEQFLEGRAATPENCAEAGRLAVEDARPISDMRASAEYRRDLVAVLTKRVLEAACAQGRATKQKGTRK